MYTCWIFIFLHINLHLIRIFLFFVDLRSGHIKKSWGHHTQPVGLTVEVQ